MNTLSPAAAVFALLGYLFMSTCDALARLLMQAGYGQAQVIASIMVLALLPITAFITAERGWRQLRFERPGLLVLLATISCAEVGAAFYALRHLEFIVEAYALFFTMPLWAALLGAVLLRERLTRWQMLAIFIGFAGVLLASWPREGTTPLGLAHGVALGVAVLSALRILITRRLGQSGKGHSLLLVMFAGLIVLNGASIETLQPYTISALPLLLLAGLVQGSAHVCFLLAVRRTQATLLAPFQFSQALWGAFYGVLLFAEWPDIAVVLGLLLVTAGGVVLLRQSRRIVTAATPPTDTAAAAP